MERSTLSQRRGACPTEQAFAPLRKSLVKSLVQTRTTSNLTTTSILTNSKYQPLNVIQAQQLANRIYISTEAQLLATDKTHLIEGKNFYYIDVEQRLHQPLDQKQFQQLQKSAHQQIVYQVPNKLIEPLEYYTSAYQTKAIHLSSSKIIKAVSGNINAINIRMSQISVTPQGIPNRQYETRYLQNNRSVENRIYNANKLTKSSRKQNYNLYTQNEQHKQPNLYCNTNRTSNLQRKLKENNLKYDTTHINDYRQKHQYNAENYCNRNNSTDNKVYEGYSNYNNFTNNKQYDAYQNKNHLTKNKQYDDYYNVNKNSDHINEYYNVNIQNQTKKKYKNSYHAANMYKSVKIDQSNTFNLSKNNYYNGQYNDAINNKTTNRHYKTNQNQTNVNNLFEPTSLILQKNQTKRLSSTPANQVFYAQFDKNRYNQKKSNRNQIRAHKIGNQTSISHQNNRSQYLQQDINQSKNRNQYCVNSPLKKQMNLKNNLYHQQNNVYCSKNSATSILNYQYRDDLSSQNNQDKSNQNTFAKNQNNNSNVASNKRTNRFQNNVKQYKFDKEFSKKKTKNNSLQYKYNLFNAFDEAFNKGIDNGILKPNQIIAKKTTDEVWKA